MTLTVFALNTSTCFCYYSISWFVLACCVVFSPIRCDLSVDKRFLLPPKNEFLEVKTRGYPLADRCHDFNCIRFKYQYMFLLIQHLSRAEIQCVSGQEPYTWENSGNWFSGVFIPLPSYSMFWQLWSPRPWAFDGLSRMSNHTWGKFLFPLMLPLFQWHVGRTSRKERIETR